MKDRAIKFQLTDYAKHTINFESLLSLLDFCTEEAKFWNERKELFKAEKIKANHACLNVGNSLIQAATAINGWKEKIDDWSDEELRRQINQLNQSYFNNFQNSWIWSGQPIVEPFLNCFQELDEVSASAFLDLSARNSVQNINNFPSFMGYMRAYEFLNQDSKITKRRNGEKVSLGHLRTQFSEARDKLFSETGILRNDFIKWNKQNRAESSRLSNIQKKLVRRKTKSQSNSFEQKMNEWTEKIETLEKTYEEKLKLKKPAEYWAKSARKYGIQGGLWTLAVISVAILAAFNFQGIFVTWLQGREIPVQFGTIQGVIIFGSLAAVYIFLLRALSRLAFSSFHLMRDSEEREQLTYLYLSLTNESEIDKESRDIVLQALFSRSETGLLSQEHGPTMPGASELLRSTLRGRGN